MGYNNPAEAMLDAVNGGVHVGEYKEAVNNAHNHLQYRLYEEILKPGIVALARTDYVDARNDSTVEACQKICDAMDWSY